MTEPQDWSRQTYRNVSHLAQSSLNQGKQYLQLAASAVTLLLLSHQFKMAVGTPYAVWGLGTYSAGPAHSKYNYFSQLLTKTVHCTWS